MERIVHTYSELALWSKSFVAGKVGLMFLIGPPGIGKTWTIDKLMEEEQNKAMRALLKKKMAATSRRKRRTTVVRWNPKTDGDTPGVNHKPLPLWLRGGTLSAFNLYVRMYEHLHQPVVVDDVDEIYQKRDCVQLLKAICQTLKVKPVAWNTTSRQLDAMGIPREYRTTSRVCIIANRWKSLSEHVGSLESRGVTVYFDPSASETFAYARKQKIVTDKEVIEVIRKHLPYLKRLDLRVLMQAQELKSAKLPWKDTVIDSLRVRELALVHDLEKDGKLRNRWHEPDVAQMAAEFARRTGKPAKEFGDYRKLLHERLAANAPAKGARSKKHVATQ